jgi:hypothetical protein
MLSARTAKLFAARLGCTPEELEQRKHIIRDQVYSADLNLRWIYGLGKVGVAELSQWLELDAAKVPSNSVYEWKADRERKEFLQLSHAMRSTIDYVKRLDLPLVEREVILHSLHFAAQNLGTLKLPLSRIDHVRESMDAHQC